MENYPDNPVPPPAPPDPLPPDIPSPAITPLDSGGIAQINVLPPTRFEEWLLRNIAPILVICASFTAEVVCELTLSSRKPAPTPVVLPGVTEHGKTSPKKTAAFRKALDEEMAKMPFSTRWETWTVAWVGLMLVYLGYSFPIARQWLARIFQKVAVRPLPALRIMDLLAIIAIIFASMRCMALLILSSSALSSGDKVAVSLILSGAGFGVGILAAVLLARHRARHPRGSEGFWPFWNLSAGQQRSIWYDVLIGILSYPPAILIMGLSVYVNHTIVYLLGRPQDEHPLMNELATMPGTGVLLILFVMATFGAAFFEETLFRGILYNVLRRYVGAAAGAFAAALIFAVMHGIASQVLGLFMLGMILTWLYDRTGRLVAGMTLHFVNNLMALAYTLLLNKHG